MTEPGLRVLFIGGDAAEEAALRERLARAGPAHVLTRVDRTRAGAALKELRRDLVLADAELPGMTPAEVAQLIRDSGQDLPVVVVTGEENEAAAVGWLEAGAFDFLTRPKFIGLWPVVARLQREGTQRERQRELELRQRGATAALLALAKSRSFDASDFEVALKEILGAGSAGAEALVAGVWIFDRPAGVLRNLLQIDRRDGHWSSGLELKFSDFPDYFRALEEEQQIVAHDAFADPRTAGLAGPYLLPKKVRALLDTGVRIGGELKGIICLEHGSPGRRWSADDQVFAAALAEATALVFEGAERMRAQERADASEDRFRELFQNSRDCIVFYRVDEKGQLRTEDFNPAALALVGVPREALVGKVPEEIVSREAAELIRLRHLEVLQSRRPVVYEHRVALPTGTFWFNTALVPSFDRQGKLHRVAAIARDVTQQRLLEQQLAQSHTLEALGQLAGHIAHDFNNLLVGVSGWATRLLGSRDPAAEESAEQILQAVSRARELTRQVLTFGQRGPSTRERLNMTTLVAEALKLLEPSLKPGVRVHAELESEGTITLGDPGQLHQVVLNLCTNALHAMDRGGKLTVRLDVVELSAELAASYPPLHEGHHLRLQIEDTGHGMDPDVASRVFEPFFTTKGSGLGTGLGLAVVHRIVQAHGGAVAVNSSVGQGTTFEVFLPALTRVKRELARPGHGERMMLVDDQLNVARASAMLFEQLGYQITVFTDPREALAAFRQTPQQFDVVMTDLSMPQMSGSELANAVHAVRAELPVIVTTGHEVSAEDRQSLGIHAVLQKPFRVEDAVQALRRVLPRS